MNTNLKNNFSPFQFFRSNGGSLMNRRSLGYSILFFLALEIGGTQDRVHAEPPVYVGSGAADSGAEKSGMPAPPKASPLREKCDAALRGDAGWMASFKAEIRPGVHKEETGRMLNNNRHVVIAYAIIWIFTVAFVAFIWIRQQKLNGEITRLEAELRRALAEEAKA